MKVGAAVIAVWLAACAMPQAEARKPPRPHPTTTTTTTTTPATTTTTTLAGCAPIMITVGGTYTGGCYQSTDPGTPAVKVSTTAPVILDHATIIHAGKGIDGTVNGVDLTVTDSKLTATDPGGTFSQRAVELQYPAALVVEHNDFTDGQGMWIGGGTPTTVRVRYNEVRNIGRYPHPTAGNCCVQFVQLDSITSPAVEIAWNRITNVYGQSDVEDNINLYQSGGTDSAHPVDIHHNLIDGAFPRDGDGGAGGVWPEATGSAAVLGDSGYGAHGIIHDNWAVNIANVGFSVSGGQDNHLYRNRVVSDGKAGTVIVSSTWGQSFTVWDGYNTGVTANIDAYDNASAFIRYNGTTPERADGWYPGCDPVSACTGNVSLPSPDAAAEQAERDAFAAALVAAGYTVGADW